MHSQTEISLARQTGACSASWLSCSCPRKLSTGHQRGHLANVGKAEVHLLQRAWDQCMSGPGRKILEDRRESSFIRDRGVDNRGVLGGILVGKQCRSPQAILISHLQFGSLSMEICRGVVCICIRLSLSTCENQLLRCYQATATELSRSTAAPTSSRAGPPGRLSQRNGTAWVFGDSAVGKYTLVYISCYMRGMFPPLAPRRSTGCSQRERKQDVLP